MEGGGSVGQSNGDEDVPVAIAVSKEMDVFDWQTGMWRSTIESSSGHH